MTLRRRLLLSAASACLCMACAPSAVAQEAGPALLPPPSFGEQRKFTLPPGTAVDGPALLNDGALAEELPPASGAYDSLLPEAVVPGDVQPPLPESLAGSMAATLAPTAEWYQPAYWFGSNPWDAGVEVGINGSESNNHVFSMRSGGHLNRETERWKLASSIVYNKNQTNGVETQNNALQDFRLDRMLKDSPWTLFVLENLIYDEFKTYDVQISLNTGLGYQWLSTDQTDLITRMGLGTLREFGGVEDDWQPTALTGFDFMHQLTKMQKLTAKVDYYPEWEDFNNYRVIADFGWEIQLDEPKNMSLKFSAIDRYDSSPDGATPNALDYAVLLIWGL